jgi:hypothetical protein
MIILTLTMDTTTRQYVAKVKVRDLPRGPVTHRVRKPKHHTGR